MKKGKIQIYIGYHKPFGLLKSQILQPLHLGRAVANANCKDGAICHDDAQWLVENTIGDNTGDNISLKNRHYAELSGIYWLWKNYENIGSPDKIGWMQYRRHFIFNPEQTRKANRRHVLEQAYSIQFVGTVYNEYQQDYGLTDQEINELVDEFDVVIPQKTHLGLRGIKSIAQDYERCINGTHVKDLKLYLRAIKKCAPEYYHLARQRLFHSNDKRCYLSFVLRKDVFFDFCEKVFSVLDYIERRLDISNYNINGKRTLAYLGELFFDVYFEALSQKAEIRIMELPMTFLCAPMKLTTAEDVKEKTAIVLLAHSDFESLEITLANYGERLKNTNAKLFILQNGRGTYDCERTLQVARRYERLYPRNFKVIADIEPKVPYLAIDSLLARPEMNEFDYICKVDDDVFPLTDDWLDKLCQLYFQEFSRYGDNVGYVTGLINNNSFGFNEIINHDTDLAHEYFYKYARPHLCGIDNNQSKYYRHMYVVDKDKIDPGMMGTIWGYPYIARFIHQQLSLQPTAFIQKVQQWPNEYIPNTERYSIGCILFRKSLWTQMKLREFNGLPANEIVNNDEFLLHMYAKHNNLILPISLSTPLVHIHYYSQRDENRDLMSQFREIYQDWLKLTYPITINDDKEIENENRLRYLEKKIEEHFHSVSLSRRIKNKILRFKHIYRRARELLTT